jgi:rubredoxin
MIAMNASNNDTPVRVGAACACPSCGEREMDRLVWNEDEQVECTTCGHVYDPESNAANGGVEGE